MTAVQRGDRVKMTGIMPEDPAPMEVGTEGTVTRVFGEGTPFMQISVKWDNSRTLMLLPDDPFAVIGTGEVSDDDDF